MAVWGHIVVERTSDRMHSFCYAIQEPITRRVRVSIGRGHLVGNLINNSKKIDINQEKT